MAIFYVDGNYVVDSKAALPLSDMAILRGYAVFDFLRTYNGKPFHLEEHLQRLQNSAALLDIGCPWQISDIIVIVNDLLQSSFLGVVSLFCFCFLGFVFLDIIFPHEITCVVVYNSFLVYIN